MGDPADCNAVESGLQRISKKTFSRGLAAGWLLRNGPNRFSSIQRGIGTRNCRKAQPRQNLNVEDFVDALFEFEKRHGLAGRALDDDHSTFQFLAFFVNRYASESGSFPDLGQANESIRSMQGQTTGIS